MSRLGLGRVPAFDMDAVCSGFLYGLATSVGDADLGPVRHGPPDRGRHLLAAHRQRRPCDGVPVRRRRRSRRAPARRARRARGGAQGEHRQRREPGRADHRPRSAVALHHAGTGGVPPGRGEHGRLRFRAMADVGWTVDDVDWFVGHQANQRILDAVANRVGIAPERAISNRRPRRQHRRGLDPARAVGGGLDRPAPSRRPGGALRVRRGRDVGSRHPHLAPDRLEHQDGPRARAVTADAHGAASARPGAEAEPVSVAVDDGVGEAGGPQTVGEPAGVDRHEHVAVVQGSASGVSSPSVPRSRPPGRSTRAISASARSCRSSARGCGGAS